MATTQLTETAESRPVVKTLSDGLDDASGLDRLRDILMGNYVRESDKRLSHYEQRLGSELQAMRQEISQRVEALEQHMTGEIQALRELLQTEQGARQAQLRSAEDHLDKLKAAFATECESSRQALNQAAHEQRKNLHESLKQARQELQRLRQELTSRMDATAQVLDGGKLDRSLLASMLAELIVRLNGAEETGLASH